MSCYFDTTVLVAAALIEEPHHADAQAAILRITNGITAAHSLAEVFSTLTGGRAKPRFTPSQAVQTIQMNILSRLRVIPISVDDYVTALTASQAAGVRGGAIFDLLHLAIARRENA